MFDIIKLTMKNKIVWTILIIAVVIVGGYFLVGDKVNLNTAKDNTLPAELVSYDVVQAEKDWPKVLNFTIDPLKVSVGDIQKMKVIAQSPAGIKSVTANIETDNGTTTVELEKTGVDKSAYVPRLKVEGNKVVDVRSNEEVNKIVKEMESSGVVSEAVASEPERGVWEGQWEVHDTHTKDYTTKFVVVDNEERVKTVGASWLDPVCNIPISGNWSLSSNGSNCTWVDGIEGVAGGDATIDSYSLVLGDNDSTDARFVVEGVVTMGSGGSIAVESDGIVDLNSTLYINNNDSDGYPDSDKTSYITNDSSRTTRTGMVSWTTDCNDWTSDVYPNNSNWYTSEISYCASDVCYTDQGYDYDCSGSEERRWPSSTACLKNSTQSEDSFDSDPGCGNDGTLYFTDCSSITETQACH